MKVETQFFIKTSPLSHRWVQTWVNRCWRHLAREKAISKKKMEAKSLVVVFVGQKRMTTLNYKFRDKNSPTDVLSFDSQNAMHLGDLVLCVPLAKAQAREHGLSLKMELGYLILHGILHLLGFDHNDRRPRAQQKMYRLQDKVFEKLRD